MSSPRDAAKKPSGGRPRPRRLFSIDTLRRDKSGSDSDTSSIASKDTTKPTRAPSNASILSRLSERPSEDGDPFGDESRSRVGANVIVQSPDEVAAFNLSDEPAARIRAPKPVALNLSRSLSTSEPEPVPSPSKRRWDTLRMHVLPSPAAPGQSTPPLQGAADTSRPGTPPSSRPSTPRGYRFGQKKIFRQVVDQARESAAGETRKLGEEILRACWAVRFGEQPRSKVEREPSQGTVGSGFLPFMSSTASLPTAPPPAVVAQPPQQQPYHRPGMRRPSSMQSVSLSTRVAPTVTHIARALTASVSVNRPVTLPYETQVLAALLVPFVGPYRGAEVEQQTAVETFEYAVRTWRAQTCEAELERCLWCCKAASIPSKSRMRLLGALSALLFSRDSTFVIETPVILRTLLQGIFSLMMALAATPNTQSELDSLRGFITGIRAGQCRTPLRAAVEKEFGVKFSDDDSDSKIRDAIITESVIATIETGSEESRRWCLRNLLEEYWSLPELSLSLTPLLSCIYCRNTKAFVSAVLSLLATSPTDAPAQLDDVDLIIRVFRSRILPGLEAVVDSNAMATQTSVITLVFELLRIQGNSEREYLMMHFCHWFQDLPEWKANIEKVLQELITSGEWPTILRMLPTLTAEFPEEVRSAMLAYLLPLLNDRLTADPPESPCPPLSQFFGIVSRSYPKVFFKPVFTCAASVKDLTIANQITVLNGIARFLPDFWARDADMISVALMSGSDSSKPKTASEGPTWAKIRTGQSVLLVELIQYLRDVRHARDLIITSSAAKFASALEARLGLLLPTREQVALVPISQRLLFCALFREIRLLTRSLKPASWLPSIVSWTLFQRPILQEDDLLQSDDEDEETKTAFAKLFALYTQAQDASRSSNKRRTTAFMSLTPDTQKIPGNTAQDALSAKLRCLKDMYRAVNSTTLELLVSVSGLLKPDNYAKLGPILWSQYLDNPCAKAVPPTCFLVMQFAEKRPEEFSQLVVGELSSPDSSVRCKAIQRIATISSWRFQILSQDVILDRTYRRPFKLARPPILFVPTDMGSVNFVLEEDPNDIKDSRGHVLPLELRRRLLEIGWEEEDQVLDPKTQWIRTPMALLPSHQLESLDVQHEDHMMDDSSIPPVSPDPSPTSSPSGGDISLLRRDSSTTGRSRGAKRRPVFVASMVDLFPVLVSLIKDPDFVVSSTARHFVIDYMRDDPTLLSRTTFHLLSGDERSVITAVTTIRTLLHVRHVLPPAIAHHLLNHVAGFLKLVTREPDTASPLQSYAYSLPGIAKLVTQVSKMSMREIRRSKLDPFLVPSGSLWAPPSAPPGPMFPRALEESQNPFETLPPSLIWITMVRTSQNMFFLSMLKRDPQDIKVIKKKMTRLVLPSMDTDSQEPLPLAAYAPHRHDATKDSSIIKNATLTALSLTLARSYLLLVGQIFRAMSRHLSDRQELAVLVDGLNLVLLTHGDDIGIVSQAMLAYMMASTRFKRMFISGGGYALFMPAIFKAYCEAEHHHGIRLAIEYAVNRFYALHQESFVFQSFDILSHLFMSSDADGTWLAGNAFTLFSTLKNAIPPSGPDIAGIHELNQQQEQEALLATVAEEVPQTFLASLRKVGSNRSEVTVEVPEEYEGKSLALDNLVRLFLTVIAHNSTIQRAERFLRLLRILAPHLYHASNSSRTVLRDGIDALGAILATKPTGKAKSAEGAQVRPPDDFSYEALSEGQGTQQALSPSDFLAMQLDFLSLVVAYTKIGGRLGSAAPQRILELVKTVLKNTHANSERVVTFLADYMKALLLQEPSPSLKEVVTLLSDYAPVVTAYATSVDFSMVFDVVTMLAGNPIFASEPPFSRLVVTQYCAAGIEACELAASENMVFPSSLRRSLVALLNRAVSLRGGDVLAVLEKRPASYDFLIGVFLPFVLTMKTSAELAEGQWVDRPYREVYAKAWMRLLAYILEACQKPHVQSKRARSLSPAGERSRSQDSRQSTSPPNPAMAFSVALQILKIIVIRAGDDLSANFPGVWAYIAGILKRVLSDGDAMFALRPRDTSEPSSPIQSPRSSSFAFQQQQDNPFLLPSSISMQSRKPLLPPRLIDYLTWSFIQWLCLRRSPLMIQMRIFIQERVAALNQELSIQGTDVSFASLNSARSGSRSRPMSTIFTKPRRSIFGDTPVSSPLASPRSSVHLNVSMSLPTFDDAGVHASTPQQEGRLAGYARHASPMSPTTRAHRESLPRIVHLGPAGAAADPVRRAASPRPLAHSARAAARETLVEGPLLVRLTYRRIRLAQAVFGYGALLPAGEGAEDDFGVRAWTRAEALDAVLHDLRDLMDEFRGEDELGMVGEDSGVLVDFEEPLSPTFYSQLGQTGPP